MNFMAAAAWGWLALALPIIALYLIRTRLERRSVSTLLFWEQIKTQSYNSALWRRLRRWFSLLLQLLFLALVAFALAQPLAPWQSAQPARLVFVLDPSASMQAREGGETRWDIAVEMVGRRIRQMRAFDRAAILVAGEPPEVLSGWTAGKRSLLAALEKARPSSGPVSLRPALALAENLRATQPNSSVMLFTDGVWKDKDEAPPGVICQWIGEPRPNTGFTHFSARRSFASPEEVRVSAEIVARGKDPVEGTVELTRNGQLADVQTVSLKPGGKWAKDWDIRANDDSVFEAKLAGFPADALPTDDVAQVKVAGLAPMQVLLVSGGNAYLEAALSSLPLIDWARVESITGFPDPKALYVFNRTLPPGGFESANVLLINPPAAGFWGQPLEQPVEKPLVSEVAKDQPLLRHTGFATVTLNAAARWEKPRDARVFVDSFGEPLIYGQWDDRRHWALFAFDLDSSDFVLRTAFPILLGNAVESLRPVQGISPSMAPGPGESALEVVAVKDEKTAAPARPASAWWFAFPLWWWAVLAGCVWLVVEWRLYTRRITE